MNKTTDTNMLYDKCIKVRELNSVEGFDPKDYLRKEETESGVSYYLDTKYRLLWFRLKYPDGKIIKNPKVLNKDYATFEVRVYADRNDAPDNYLANGYASRYKDETDVIFGLNFVEAAETAALGRALKDAGFGTQFCDIALPNDENKVDAGVELTLDIQEENTDIAEENSQTSGQPEIVAEIKEEPLNENMPYEEILEKMTLDYAKRVVVDYGFDSGKTLGEIATSKPKSIEFYALRATNNLVKAAAQFLINEAEKIA